MHLINWKAKRAGGRITVYGVGSDEGRKIVGVDVITPHEPCICKAVDKNGEAHFLQVG